jgi:serine/threonine protein kinase
MSTTSLTGRSIWCSKLRDIKPENFLLKHKNNTDNVKLIDFGLSKDYSETVVMQTPSGSVISFSHLEF